LAILKKRKKKKTVPGGREEGKTNRTLEKLKGEKMREVKKMVQEKKRGKGSNSLKTFNILKDGRGQRGKENAGGHKIEHKGEKCKPEPKDKQVEREGKNVALPTE